MQLTELQIETIIAEMCGTYRTGGSYTFEDVWNCIEKALAAHSAGAQGPIDMLLFCPKCGTQHVDAPEPFTPTGRCECAGPDECEACESNRAAFEEIWQNPPHRSHLCHSCGTIWRPADVPTNGVAAIKTQGKNDYVRRPPAATAVYAQPQPMTDAARDEAKEYALLTLRRITRWPDGGNNYGQDKIKSYVIDALAEIERLDLAKGE